MEVRPESIPPDTRSALKGGLRSYNAARLFFLKKKDEDINRRYLRAEKELDKKLQENRNATFRKYRDPI